MFRTLISLMVLVALAGSARADEFGDLWYDGKAELDGYRLEVSRYGEPRQGTAVMIFVTEPFSQTERVKADKPGPTTFNAFKLNLVRDFQTGIYDYNTMVSVFTHDSDFALSKVSFSSAEWCGHMYQDLIVHPDRVDGRRFSYFAGESGDYSLEHPKDGIQEDQLFVLVRSLRNEFLASGETRTFPFLPGPYVERLQHKEPGWTDIEITRRKNTQSLSVPAGSFQVRVYDLKVGDGREGTFYVEDAYPHRIVRWELPPDQMGELTGSIREPYWSLNHNGHESYLKELGLDD